MAHIKTQYSKLWHPESTHEKADSQKMFVENIEQHEKNYVELIKRVHTKVGSIDELKSINVTAGDIEKGTLVLVVGVGIYYYTTTKPDLDDDYLVKPASGSGWWALSGGTGGGNLVVSDEDYGEDVDADNEGVILKIKKLFTHNI